jgi:hypothetical protein
MNLVYTVINDYSKVEAYQYLDDHPEYNIVFNLKTFADSNWNQYLNLDMVASLFAPLVAHERFVVTVLDLDHEKVTQTHIIRYHIILRDTVPKIYELRYYIQLYNWPANLYILDGIYSEMRNVSLNDNSELRVTNDCELLGFYKAVDSHVFIPEDTRYKLYSAPKLCSSCQYYSNEVNLPCAVNAISIVEMRKNDFSCKDYLSKYLFDITQ